MMFKHYPELFEGDPDYDKACDLANRVFELSDFLLNVLKVELEDKGDPLKITWHGSCHSQRKWVCVNSRKICSASYPM